MMNDDARARARACVCVCLSVCVSVCLCVCLSVCVDRELTVGHLCVSAPRRSRHRRPGAEGCMAKRLRL